MKNKFSSEQSGRSMIEMIGYISVAMVIGISLLTAVNSGFYRFKLGRLNQELTDLKKVISQRYVAAEDYSEVDFQTLIDEKIVPHDVRDKSHAMGGDVEIGPADEGKTFYIKFNNLTSHACMELGGRLWIVNDGSDLERMEINEKIWKWPNALPNGLPSNGELALPATPADIAQACTVCKDEDNQLYPCQQQEVYITWYFN